jgi:hypothetical protein
MGYNVYDFIGDLHWLLHARLNDQHGTIQELRWRGSLNLHVQQTLAPAYSGSMAAMSRVVNGLAGALGAYLVAGFVGDQVGLGVSSNRDNP